MNDGLLGIAGMTENVAPSPDETTSKTHIARGFSMSARTLKQKSRERVASATWGGLGEDSTDTNCRRAMRYLYNGCDTGYFNGRLQRGLPFGRNTTKQKTTSKGVEILGRYRVVSKSPTRALTFWTDFGPMPPDSKGKGFQEEHQTEFYRECAPSIPLF